MVQKAPSSTVGDLATALLELFEADNAIEMIHWYATWREI